uniref:Serpentine receptor class gamma n=1 Tax=Steinernema glaseri TaxID=37863 RepID=A0A1I8APK7_9BILA
MLPTAKLPYLEHVELALDIVGPFSALYFLFLLRRPVFHLNLRILLAHFSIGLAMMTFLRMFILVDSMMPGTFLTGKCAFWVHLLHNGFVLTLMDASVLMAGERFVATILVDRYERIKYWMVTVAMCAAMSFVNMYISYFVMIRGQNAVIQDNGQLNFEYAHYNMDIIYSLVVLTTMNVAGVVVFFVLFNFNRKRWQKDRTKKLGHRYQIAENMKTSKQLSIVLLANLVISAYLFFVLYYVLAVSKRNRFTDTLSQFFDITVAAAAILLPCLFIKPTRHRKNAPVSQQGGV